MYSAVASESLLLCNVCISIQLFHPKACSQVLCVSVVSSISDQSTKRGCLLGGSPTWKLCAYCSTSLHYSLYEILFAVLSIIHWTKNTIHDTISLFWNAQEFAALNFAAIIFTFHCTPSACVPCVYPIVNQQLNHINIPWHQNWLRSVLCTIVRNTVQWTILHYRADAPLHQTWLWSVLQYEILFWNTGQMHQTWLRCRFLGSGRRDGWTLDALSTDSYHRRHHFYSYCYYHLECSVVRCH